MSNELAWMPATELAPMIAARKISPVEVIDAVLAHIERTEPKVNAFAHLAADRAREAAKRAEAAVIKGGKLGSLHGVTVTIKDLSWTKDMPMEGGSWSMKGNQPPEDAPHVARLTGAGAIALGKTTTSEFGWSGVSRSPLTGITSNPWKQGYNTGASSAGAGAAAAAGYGPLHQGSDGAGSIRMPSHFSGIYGLKPSFGRVPYYPVGGGDYTSHIGPMTRTVADAALMLKAMAGPHSLDHTSLDGTPADYLGLLDAGIAGRKIAYSPDLGVARVDPDVAELVRAAAGRFVELGATVDEVPTPWAKEGPELIRFFWPAHTSRHMPRLRDFEAKMDPGLVACVKQGGKIAMQDYQAMRERKYAYCAAQQRWFEDWDFLLTPAVSVPAFPAERLIPEHWPQHPWDWLQWAEFSYPFNFSGNPACSVPCGFTKDGLPAGLQIVGRRYDDLGVLQASAAFERLAPWADKRPTLD